MSKVSIIIPVYNVEKYLEKCIKSVLQQSYHNLEIILINDGSTDNCLEICKKYTEIDNRIILVEQKNAGLSAARNAGINICTGDYIFFLDSDDYLRPTTIKELISECKKRDADIVGCGYLPFSENEELQQEITYKEEVEEYNSVFYFQKMSNHAWGKLYKSSLFKENKICYPLGRNYEDVATTFKLIWYADKIVYIPKILYLYLKRDGSISRELSEKNIDDFLLAYLEMNEFYKEKCQIETPEIAYYQLTILFTIYSRLISSNVITNNKKKEKSRLIQSEFRYHSKAVNLWKYLLKPYTIKLLLYKFKLAGIMIRLRNLRGMK